MVDPDKRHWSGDDNEGRNVRPRLANRDSGAPPISERVESMVATRLSGRSFVAGPLVVGEITEQLLNRIRQNGDEAQFQAELELVKNRSVQDQLSFLDPHLKLPMADAIAAVQQSVRDGTAMHRKDGAEFCRQVESANVVLKVVGTALRSSIAPERLDTESVLDQQFERAHAVLRVMPSGVDPYVTSQIMDHALNHISDNGVFERFQAELEKVADGDRQDQWEAVGLYLRPGMIEAIEFLQEHVANGGEADPAFFSETTRTQLTKIKLHLEKELMQTRVATTLKQRLPGVGPLARGQILADTLKAMGKPERADLQAALDALSANHPDANAKMQWEVAGPYLRSGMIRAIDTLQGGARENPTAGAECNASGLHEEITGAKELLDAVKQAMQRSEDKNASVAARAAENAGPRQRDDRAAERSRARSSSSGR